MKKIVFISTHDYKAKRQGGFHVFAEKLSKDFDVIFFSYPRSFFIKIRKKKLIEYDNISYCKDRDEMYGNVRNISTMLFIPPVSILRYFPKRVVEWAFRLRLPSFKKYCKQHFKGVDYFILESNPSVIIFDYLRQEFPQAKFLYRPSDPMLKSPELKFYHEYEINVIRKCNFIFAVNQDGVDLYRQYVPELGNNRIEIISNGIEMASYEKTYSIPKEYEGLNNRICYIGARPAEWGVVIEAAKRVDNANFIVICPEVPPQNFMVALKELKNLHYIQGISPSLVPQFVTNADIIMIPNPTGMYKKYPWGITAKYYQAMRSGKQIVVYSDDAKLKKYGIVVTQTFDEFIVEILNALQDIHRVNYDFDFSGKDWNFLTSKMKSIIDTI